MPERIKVALITQADGSHLDAYYTALAQTSEAETVVLADASGNSEAAARKAIGDKLTKSYKDVGAMLREEQPVMALVSMEGAAAPPVIDAALDAGCHVFAEKPACVRAADFEPLVRKAESKHRHLMLAFANRLNPDIVAAKKLILSGEIGKVYGLEMHLIADHTRLTRPEYGKRWVAQKSRAGGGNLIWLGIHFVDLSMYLTHAKITEVAGFSGKVGSEPYDVEDSSALSLRFDNGTFGTFTSGYYLDAGYHMHLKFWGTHGWIEMTPRSAVPFEWYSTKSKTPHVEQYKGPTEPNGYTPFVRAAVRASAGLEEAPITGAEGLHVLKSIFAFYEAAATGKAQRVV